jgi:hypothetical protein
VKEFTLVEGRTAQKVLNYIQILKTVEGSPIDDIAYVIEELAEELFRGRPEIDSWGVVFTPEGPKPRRVSIEFEILQHSG